MAASLPTLFLLTLLMLSSLAIITLAVRTIPFLTLPTDLHHVTAQIHHLKAYSSASTTQFLHLATILSMIFVWKQAFSIPGTILLNVLIGAIYGPWLSTFFTCFLTAIGSTCAYHMARSIRPIVIRLFPSPLAIIERAVDRFKIPGTTNRYDTAELSSYLLIARFLPVVPYAALNLASGVLELPLVPFFWTLVLGSLPYNFLTTQVGDILSTAVDSGLVSDPNHPDLTKIWSNALLVKLAVISLLGALPVLFKNQLWNLIQALIQTRRSLPLPSSSSSSSFAPLSNKRQYERHQSCRDWVSDIGSKRESLFVFDHSDRDPHYINFADLSPTTSSDASSHVYTDHSDDQSEPCSLLSPQDQEGSTCAPSVINLDPSTCDDNASGPIPDLFSPNHSAPSLNQTTKPMYKTNNDPLPLFFSQNPSSKPNSNSWKSNLSIHSLFDLPYRKVANIVSDNLVLPK